MPVTDREVLIDNSRVSVWWHTEDGPRFFINLGIFRLMGRANGYDAVIFDCLLPDCLPFIYGVNGSVVEVRYVDHGRLDNYLAGVALFYLNNVRIKEKWINKLSTVDYDDRQLLRMKIHATCDIDIVMSIEEINNES